jgi:hypothetical protein
MPPAMISRIRRPWSGKHTSGKGAALTIQAARRSRQAEPYLP